MASFERNRTEFFIFISIRREGERAERLGSNYVIMEGSYN
jgi:hypothetical protein